MGSDGSERTEQPTSRKLEQARQRGQVARSKDLSMAFAGGVVLIVMVAMMSGWLAELRRLLRSGIMRATGVSDGTLVATVHSALADGLSTLALVLAPVFGATMVVAVIVGAVQTRGLFVPGLIKPDGQRLIPRLGRVFSASSVVEAGKGLLVAAILIAVAWVCVSPWFGGLPNLVGRDSDALLTVLGLLSKQIGLGFVIATLLVGVGDYLWQWRRNARELRMTHEEVKREYKESEGDPHNKAERQRLHREVLQERMLSDVRKADFIVVNPDHLAIAIRYDREGVAAPVILASGENMLAQRIKEIAREAGVPIFRDITLARSLRDVPEGEEIPEELFEAIAEILRVVYGMEEESSTKARGRQPSRSPGRQPDREPDPSSKQLRRGLWRKV